MDAIEKIRALIAEQHPIAEGELPQTGMQWIHTRPQDFYIGPIQRDWRGYYCEVRDTVTDAKTTKEYFLEQELRERNLSEEMRRANRDYAHASKKFRKKMFWGGLGATLAASIIGRGVYYKGVYQQTPEYKERERVQQLEEQREKELDEIAVSIIPEGAHPVLYHLGDNEDVFVYTGKEGGEEARLGLLRNGIERFLSESWSSDPNGNAKNLEIYECRKDLGWLTLKGEEIPTEKRQEYSDLLAKIAKKKVE